MNMAVLGNFSLCMASVVDDEIFGDENSSPSALSGKALQVARCEAALSLGNVHLSSQQIIEEQEKVLAGISPSRTSPSAVQRAKPRSPLRELQIDGKKSDIVVSSSVASSKLGSPSRGVVLSGKEGDQHQQLAVVSSRRIVGVDDQRLSLLGERVLAPVGSTWVQPDFVGNVLDSAYEEDRQARLEQRRLHEQRKGSSKLLVEQQESRLLARQAAMKPVTRETQGTAVLFSPNGATRCLITSELNQCTCLPQVAYERPGDSLVTSKVRGVLGDLIEERNNKSSDDVHGFQTIRKYLRPEFAEGIERSRSLAYFETIYEKNVDELQKAFGTLQFGGLALNKIFDDALAESYKFKRGMSKEAVEQVKEAHRELCMATLEWHNLYTSFGSICMLGAGNGNGVEASEFFAFPKQVLVMLLVGKFHLKVGDMDIPVRFDSITTFSGQAFDRDEASIVKRMFAIKAQVIVNDEREEYQQYQRWLADPFAMALFGVEPEKMQLLDAPRQAPARLMAPSSVVATPKPVAQKGFFAKLFGW